MKIFVLGPNYKLNCFFFIYIYKYIFKGLLVVVLGLEVSEELGSNRCPFWEPY